MTPLQQIKTGIIILEKIEKETVLTPLGLLVEIHEGARVEEREFTDLVAAGWAPLSSGDVWALTL